MEEQLAHFPRQFTWEPEIQNGERIPSGIPVVVCGMGGSHLAADLLRSIPACPPLLVHSGYGLPHLPPAWRMTALHIVMSQSGDTEESLDVAKTAYEAGVPLAVITQGGALGAFATEHTLPLIVLPNEGLVPRMALGHHMLALLALLKETRISTSLQEAAKALDVEEARAAGTELAATIGTRIPAFYISERNKGIAYYFKIAMNETGKVPATYNVFPEVCHNELEGYESSEPSLFPVLVTYEQDDVRIHRRMRLFKTILEERRIPHTELTLVGEAPLHMLRAIALATAAGIASAKTTGKDAAATPLIDEFKKKLRA